MKIANFGEGEKAVGDWPLAVGERTPKGGIGAELRVSRVSSFRASWLLDCWSVMTGSALLISEVIKPTPAQFGVLSCWPTLDA